jgi:hypothetical protein
MPHLDFRKAFSSVSDAVSTAVSTDHLPHPPTPSDLKAKRSLATRLPQLHRSDRTTILFAILVFVGGLFCAFYFFNGAEILSAAAAWSREFLYPRPSLAGTALAKIDNSQQPAPPAAGEPDKKPADRKNPLSQPGSSNSSSPALGNSSDGLIGGLPGGSVNPGPGPGSLLDQLGLPPTGGDALIQSFNKAVDNLSRATNAFANSTVTVVKGAVVQVPVKPTTRAAVSTARNAMSANASRTQQAVRNAQQTKASFTGSKRGPLYSPDTIIGGTTLQSIGGIGGGLGGLGGGSGAGAAVGGGAAGVAGGIGGLGGLGGIGGAVGGLGGSGK